MSSLLAVVGQTGKPISLSRFQQAIDWELCTAVLLLLGFGLVMVESASIANASLIHRDPFYFVWRQLAGIVLGLGLAVIVIAKVPVKTLESSSYFFLLLTCVLLVAVLLVGREVNGATRWLDFGIYRLQVSEFAKLGAILYLASYMVRHRATLQASIGGFWRPMVMVVLMAVLLILEPDFGATVVLFATVLGMMWVGGALLKQFGLLVGLCLAAGWALVVFEPYRLQRIISFRDPWADVYGAGYQLSQSLIAVGSGSITGLGLGNSVQKLNYLPEAHTDFIFSVIAEELGLLGVAGVLVLYGYFLSCIFRVALRAERAGMGFGAFVAYGIGFWIATQVLVNLGVAMGVLPTKGLTLPLISYGGSSVMAMLLALGLLMRIALESNLRLSRSERG